MKGNHKEWSTRRRTAFWAIIVISLLLSTYAGLRIFQREGGSSSQSPPILAGEIYFYEDTQYSDISAIGMVINDTESMIFIWNKTSNITQIEVDYICPPEFENEFKIILENGQSPYTGGKIVPCYLNKTVEGVYEFKYYDGWALHWSFGYARLYLTNETIQYMSHVR